MADEVMVSQTVILPGVVPALDVLKEAGLDLGIVSTKFKYRIDDTLARHGLGDRFGVIVGGNDVDALKPAPDGLLLGLRRLGVSPDEAIYVGDHSVDAQAAGSAGVPFVGVLSGCTDGDGFESYPRLAVLDSVADLPSFLTLDPETQP
jgi:phosphoglycolate phosphatase